MSPESELFARSLHRQDSKKHYLFRQVFGLSTVGASVSHGIMMYTVTQSVEENTEGAQKQLQNLFCRSDDPCQLHPKNRLRHTNDVQELIISNK